MDETEAVVKWPKLTGVHPVLIRRLTRVLLAMEALGFPMRPTDGARTLAEQQALYAKGRTAPGPRVTDADGVRVVSNHQVKEDGYGHAVDCAFFVPGMNPWDDDLPWEAYGQACRAVGLRWGIVLKNGTVDRPHAELPRSL